MEQHYPALSMQRLSGVVCYAKPSQALPEQVTLESPAIMPSSRIAVATVARPYAGSSPRA